MINRYKNIVLTGFMGSGKTFVGKYISKNLCMGFIDTDILITKYCSLTIHQIFKLKGESYFRNIEFKICKKICNLNNYIIASGGGTLLFERNLKLFRDRSFIVFLDIPFSVCYSRIVNTDRPIVNVLSKLELYDLYLKRRKQYIEVSDILIKMNF